MNKYKEYQKFDDQNAALRNLEHQELTAARMHKPGYRRKMRHTNNKHTRKAKDTSR